MKSDLWNFVRKQLKIGTWTILCVSSCELPSSLHRHLALLPLKHELVIMSRKTLTVAFAEYKKENQT